jgi:hypothetical protein
MLTSGIPREGETKSTVASWIEFLSSSGPVDDEQPQKQIRIMIAGTKKKGHLLENEFINDLLT